MKQHSVYSSYQARVNYACRVIANRGPFTRAYDTCFESGDADKVVHAILNRSRSNTLLLAGLRADGNGKWLASLIEKDRLVYQENAVYPLIALEKEVEPTECAHADHEDCMICSECGGCKESLDEDDICDECRTLNLYCCPCGHEWQSTAGCGCNDHCPHCHLEIQPYKSIHPTELDES